MTARLTDELIRVALRPAPDVAAPDHFMSSMLSGMATETQRREGRLNMLGRSALASMRLVLIALLLLALLIGAVWIAAQRDRSFANGPVLLASASGLTSIDPRTGRTIAAFPGDGNAAGIGRSPDGRLVGYWVTNGMSTHLWLANSDGTGAREIAIDADVSAARNPGIVIFSMDSSTFIATVFADAQMRLAVARVDDGTATLVGPRDIGGYDLSPDGTAIAFNYGQLYGQHDSIGVMNVDGTNAHPITDNRMFNSHGPDSWSSDGWIYFGADVPSEPAPETFPASNGVFRVRVADSNPIRLTASNVVADAASLSPDERRLAYQLWRPGMRPDVWIMNPDGSDQHLLAATASFLGWSADSQSILAEVHHTDGRGDLSILPIDGSAATTLMSRPACSGGCFSDVSWGFPRP